MLKLSFFLLIYLFILITVVFIFYNLNLTLYYSITIGLIIGQILLLCYPINKLTENYGSSYALYLLIQYGTITWMYIFVIITIVQYYNSKRTVINITSPTKNIKINVE